MSVSGKIHKALYGKSDEVNAKENQNVDFQAGYKVGMNTRDTSEERIKEWHKRGCPEKGIEWKSFKEWKRGLWAAVMQKSVAGIK